MHLPGRPSRLSPLPHLLVGGLLVAAAGTACAGGAHPGQTAAPSATNVATPAAATAAAATQPAATTTPAAAVTTEATPAPSGTTPAAAATARSGDAGKPAKAPSFARTTPAPKQMVPVDAGRKLPAGWQQFNSPEGDFSVAMPGTPKREESATSTSFVVMKPDALYEVMYNDLGLDGVTLDDEATNAMLDVGVKAGVASVDGTLLDQSPITLDGHPGRAFRVAAVHDGQDIVVTDHVYLVNDRLYQVLAGVPRTQLSAKQVTLAGYFHSFTLTGAQASGKASANTR